MKIDPLICFHRRTEQHFPEVVGSEEFLNLGMEQVSNLIASDKLTIPTEEKVGGSFPRPDLLSSHCSPFFFFFFTSAGVRSGDRLGQPR